MPLDITSPWAIAVLVFVLRILDVSIGTVRTIFVVRGHVAVAMMLGFVEVGIWITAVTPVVMGVQEHPYLALAFAGGFSTGNAVGIMVERKLALGRVVVRLVSKRPGRVLEQLIGDIASGVVYFEGTGNDGHRTLVYATCTRRHVGSLLTRVQESEPDLFYVVERFSQIGNTPLPHPTGWRTAFKKK